MKPAGITALMFHHVGPPKRDTQPALTVRPERFRRLLIALERSGHVGLAAREWSPAATDVTGAGRPIILTFDDAYAELMDFALPVLIERGHRATVFVVAGAIGGTNAWDAASGAGGHRLMSADDLRAWAAHGCEVGAHGMTHVALTSLDPEVLAREVEAPQRVLEEIVGSAITSFAYPYGAHDPQVRATVMRTYRLGFGIEEGRNDPHSDLSRLRRTMVQPADTALDVVLRAWLGWSPFQRGRALVRPRSRLQARLGGTSDGLQSLG